MTYKKALLTTLAMVAVLSFQIVAINGSAQTTKRTAPVTFSKDIAPILQKQCASCHRPGGMAPMSLLSYKDTRPWAKSIRENVVKREMPPWHADPRYGEFANDRRLSQGEVDTIAAWVDGGALKGDDKDLPPPLTFNENWRIGNPDLVLSMTEEFTLAADGPDEYQYFVIPTNFTEDRWVRAAEARPGNNKIVHHMIAFIQPARPKTQEGNAGSIRRDPARMKESIFYKDGTLIRVKPSAPVFDNGCATPEGGQGVFTDGTGRDTMLSLLCGQAPGRDADIWPAGTAKKIPAGANLLIQMHYAKNGSVEKDRSTVGLIFAKEAPERELVTIPIQNHFFSVPPGAENHEVTSCFTFGEGIRIVSLMPHMHLRGKDMQIKAAYPDGKSEILLSVPNYSFNWQATYYLKKPLAVPKGTRIEVTAHFDNSTKNKYNPDPTKVVRWGDPTYDEMMIGWMDYISDSPGQVKPATSASNR